MFYINEEKLVLSQAAKSDSLIAQSIAAKLAEFQKTLEKKPLRLKWRDGVMKVNKKSRLKEGKRGVFVPFTAMQNNSQGTNTVTYCESAIKHQNTTRYEPKGEWFKGTKILGINDIELAIYYSLFCPYVKSGLIVIENRDAEASERAKAHKKMAQYSWHLYHESSPLYEDVERLTEIAKAFGVPNTSGMALDTLKEAINNAVTVREASHQDGIQLFERYFKGEDWLMKPKSDIQTAIDMGELRLDFQTSAWKTKGGIFLQLKPTELFDSEVAKVAVAKYINDNKDAYGVINAIINSEKSVDVPVLSGKEDLDTMDWEAMKALAKSHGVTVKLRKPDQVREELRKVLFP